MFVSNGLIGLREGLEAGLVITVLVAFLNGRGRSDQVRVVWTGVVAALIGSVLAGMIIGVTVKGLSARGEAIFEAVISGVAVVLITAMVFWMRHSLADEHRKIEQAASRALVIGPVAVFLVAFSAVLREGVEAAVFVLVLAEQGSWASSISGLLAGVVLAAGLTWLLYRGVVRINMARLLTVTGVLLTVIAGGVLAHAVGKLQEVGLLPGAEVYAFDISAALSPDSWWGHFVSGMIGLSSHPTVLGLVTWIAYVAIVLTAFTLMLRGKHADQISEPADRLA